MIQYVPRVAFLGVAERAAQVPDEITQLPKYNIMGLKNVVVSCIYPLSLIGQNLVFALYRPLSNPHTVVKVVDGSGKQIGFINMELNASHQEVGDSSPPLYGEGYYQETEEWLAVIVPANHINFFIPAPGSYQLLLSNDTEDIPIGRLFFGLVEPEPLTEARKTAIKSTPTATRAVQFHYQCNICQKGIKAYAGLEPMANLEAEGCIWYKKLPEEFCCSCHVTVDLRILRKNFHAFLGPHNYGQEALSFIPLYEKGAIEAVYQNFSKLLASNSSEETLQKFIENNPILLHSFAAKRIFFKSPILTKYKTDFTIVNNQQELILIEIEKTSTKLMKVNGHRNSELQHAVDQVNDWLHVTKDHLLSVLECIGIKKEEVATVRGVVIAGRDAGYSAEHLRKLKGTDFGNLTFLTYDDLLAGLNNIIRSVTTL